MSGHHALHQTVQIEGGIGQQQQQRVVGRVERQLQHGRLQCRRVAEPQRRGQHAKRCGHGEPTIDVEGQLLQVVVGVGCCGCSFLLVLLHFGNGGGVSIVAVRVRHIGVRRKRVTVQRLGHMRM